MTTRESAHFRLDCSGFCETGGLFKRLFGIHAEFRQYARSLTEIVRAEPRIVNRDGAIRILLQGDDGYDD